MTTISAKELRLNLKETLKRVSEGEEIIIIYKSKPLVRLCPIEHDTNALKISDKFKKYIAGSGESKYARKKNFDYKQELYEYLKKKYTRNS